MVLDWNLRELQQLTNQGRLILCQEGSQLLTLTEFLNKIWRRPGPAGFASYKVVRKLGKAQMPPLLRTASMLRLCQSARRTIPTVKPPFTARTLADAHQYTT